MKTKNVVAATIVVAAIAAGAYFGIKNSRNDKETANTEKMNNDSAVVVVDMLYDFIDGSLACLNADNAVASTVKYLEGESAADLPVLFIRDHHPADHCSFTEQGGIWPSHCVAGTRGAEVHESLQKFMAEELTFDKGCNKEEEQYSGFDGRNAAGQSLAEVLELLEVKDVYVVGIATEYCVRNTAEDLQKAGFGVHLIKDCLAYVDAQGHEDALKAMEEEGIDIL